MQCTLAPDKKVVTPDGDTEEFEITAGVLQGDTLAPFIFVIVLDYVLRKAISGRESEFGFMLTPRAIEQKLRKGHHRLGLRR